MCLLENLDSTEMEILTLIFCFLQHGLVPQLSNFQQSSSLLWNVLQDFLYFPLIPPSHWGDFAIIAQQTGKFRMCLQAAIQTGTELYTQHPSRDCLTKSYECSGSVFPILVSGMRSEKGRTKSDSSLCLPPSSPWTGQYPASGFWSKALAFFHAQLEFEGELGLLESKNLIQFVHMLCAEGQDRSHGPRPLAFKNKWVKETIHF